MRVPGNKGIENNDGAALYFLSETDADFTDYVIYRQFYN